MKKKIIFTLMIAVMASALWAQNFGLTISYKDGNVPKEQTFNLDSVLSYGYNLDDQTVFVQPDIGARLAIPYQNLISFGFPPIVPDSVGVSDYLVVNVDGQKAAFLLEEGFEMTWRGGVLAIKDKKQSQSIGLKNGIFFTVEKLSFGYTNPKISSTPGTGSWYVVVELFNGLYQYSYSDKCYVSYNPVGPTGNPDLTFLSDKTPVAVQMNDAKNGRIYISSSIVGNLYN
jgi:hypothetical protein